MLCLDLPTLRYLACSQRTPSWRRGYVLGRRQSLHCHLGCGRSRPGISRQISFGRGYSRIGLFRASPKIAVAAAFLQNTLEQAFIALFAHLALVLVLGDAALPIVSGSVVLFGIDRAAFLAGYPKGAGARSFGMALTVLPSLFALALSIAAAISRATH